MTLRKRKQGKDGRKYPKWLSESEEGVKKVVEAYERLSKSVICACERLPMHTAGYCEAMKKADL